MSENSCQHHKATEVNESRLGLSRRNFLTGVATFASAVGLTAIADSATAATKKYKVCSTKDVKVKGANRFQINTASGPMMVIITQPKAGVYRAFNATCTHMGALIGAIDQTGSTLICEAHGARFNSDSGKVTGGPAPKPLTKYTVTTTGTTLYINA